MKATTETTRGGADACLSLLLLFTVKIKTTAETTLTTSQVAAAIAVVVYENLKVEKFRADLRFC